jgi:pyridoxamine 5'-phosphate oxidase family protein
MSNFTQSELEYLEGQRLGRLATSKADGTLQNSPVGFQFNPDTDTIDINGFNLEKSQKFRNIASNGRAAFVIDDLVSVEPWRVRCLEIRGKAEAIEVGGVPIIRLHPRQIISFGIDESVAAHELTTNNRRVG